MLLKVILYAYLQNVHSGRAYYGSEMNYEYMVSNQLTPFVKYNLFHADIKRKRRNNPFYVCPMGQDLESIGTKIEVIDLGYISVRNVYHSKDCSRCPLRSICYTGQHKTRTIVVNHCNNELRAMARELLTSEEGLMHRSGRPIEPEAAFGQIKHDNSLKRFSYRGKRLVAAEFAAIAVAHNIRKMIARDFSREIEMIPLMVGIFDYHRESLYALHASLWAIPSHDGHKKHPP